MDLVYGPEPTALVREAKDRGAIAIDGKEMLVLQAAARTDCGPAGRRRWTS